MVSITFDCQLSTVDPKDQIMMKNENYRNKSNFSFFPKIETAFIILSCLFRSTSEFTIWFFVFRDFLLILLEWCCSDADNEIKKRWKIERKKNAKMLKSLLSSHRIRIQSNQKLYSNFQHCRYGAFLYLVTSDSGTIYVYILCQLPNVISIFNIFVRQTMGMTLETWSRIVGWMDGWIAWNNIRP